MVEQWWKGNLTAQDAYLEQMSRGLASALQRLVGDLELCGFDYHRLYARAPAAAANHVLLLGHSHQYVSAMARLAESRGDRLKMWRGARHASNDGELTKAGQALLTAEHPVQDLEIDTLQARAAWLKLAYFTQSCDYRAAAAQVAPLQHPERRRPRRVEQALARWASWGAVCSQGGQRLSNRVELLDHAHRGTAIGQACQASRPQALQNGRPKNPLMPPTRA